MSEVAARIRLDKWLWHARFYKTRSLAAQTVARGAIRVNSERTNKAAYGLKVGDVLTFALNGRVRVIEVTALSSRRGPATEAQGLYIELTNTSPSDRASPPHRA
ncbi:MAG: RNA-binding S4 domain-containing protein [Pseudomonadota bacterium]